MRARPGHPPAPMPASVTCACVFGLKIRCTPSIHAGLQGVRDVQRAVIVRICMGAQPLRGGLLADLLDIGGGRRQGKTVFFAWSRV